jgi:hypothetical protein
VDETILIRLAGGSQERCERHRRQDGADEH